MSDTTHYTPDVKADPATIRDSVPCRRVRRGGEFTASDDWTLVDCVECHAAHYNSRLSGNSNG